MGLGADRFLLHRNLSEQAHGPIKRISKTKYNGAPIGMNNFTFFFKMGWHHIISPDAIDHILFIGAMTCLYRFSDYKKLLVLVTAFTVGHCITLVLSSTDTIRFPISLAEFLIPVTIVVAAASNFFALHDKGKNLKTKYFFALLFGLVHGLGFASAIRFMLQKAEHIAVPLLGFNLGLEAGQIAMVLFLLLLAEALIRYFRLSQRFFVNFISLAAILVGLYFMAQRIPF